jgi:hypothetical protein
MNLQSLLDEPAMAVPSGVSHNFVNSINMASEGYDVSTTCLVVSVLAVGMRLWTKTRLIHKVFLEDCNSFHHCLKHAG